MEKVEILKKFILENDLYFEGLGSDLNSDCCVISGYALFIRAEQKYIEIAIEEARPDHSSDYMEELTRVFTFAKSNHYEDWWKSSHAKKLLKF